jgi:hypothetical protein
MEKSIKENREEFYLKYYDLFEDGTLREIYTGEKISVYAVAEKNYGVVPFTDRFPEDSYMFLNINEVEAKKVVQDEEFFLEILNDRKSKNRVPFLNQKSKIALQKINAARIEAGTWEITPEMDAEVLGNKGLTLK